MTLSICARSGVLVVLVLALGACKANKNQPMNSSAGRTAQAGAAGEVSEVAGSPAPDAGPSGLAGDGVEQAGDAGAVMHTLSISPANPVLDVSGVRANLQLSAELDGVTAPIVSWSADDVLVGVIESSGNFRAFGDRAGSVTVTARVGSLSTTTRITVHAALVDNVSNVADPDIALLRQGGSADSKFAWLYPYDGTVFPKGLGAPLMQFAGGAADALSVRVSCSGFSYEGFYAPTGPTQDELDAGASADRSTWPVRATLSEHAWDSILHSTKGTEDITVRVTKLAAGQVSAQVTQHWRIADGELQGNVYYNTYNSGMDVGGSIMRVPFGGSFEPLKGENDSDPKLRCVVCHSVSANGA